MIAALSHSDRALKLFGAAPLAFSTVGAAVFWCMQAKEAQRHGERHRPGPCSPDDIAAEIDRLYRRRVISLTHARVLRIYGERGRAPDPHHERADWLLWVEAVRPLDTPLRLRGWVS